MTYTASSFEQLTLSWRRSLSYRNHSIDLLCLLHWLTPNQWTGFYMITASVMKELTHKSYYLPSFLLNFSKTFSHSTSHFLIFQNDLNDLTSRVDGHLSFWTYFSPVLHFMKKPVICFAVQNKLLVSTLNVALSWYELISSIATTDLLKTDMEWTLLKKKLMKKQIIDKLWPLNT